MKTITRADWIAALRSGEYAQGVRRLFDPETNSYCCLGVAARIAGATEQQLQDCFIQLDGELAPIAEMLEIEGISPDRDRLSRQGVCMTWNDEDSLTFAQIADKIEAGEV